MIKKIFKLLNINSIDEFKAFVWQFIKFGIVGVSNTAISYITYYLLIEFSTFFNNHYMLSNTIAFIVSVINAYIWNSKLVFKQSKDTEEKEKAKSAAKLFISYTFTFVLSNVLLYVWVDKLGIDKRIAPIINWLITIPLNFLLNKYWSFNEKKINEKIEE